MKFWIFSDLHRERPDPHIHPQTTEPFDGIICAGDVAGSVLETGLYLTRLAADYDKPFIFVPGNHEFYDQNIDFSRFPRQIVQQLWVDPDTGENVRLIGATLWTDYNLDGDPVGAMQSAALMIGDHTAISRIETNHKSSKFGSPVRFMPSDALDLHQIQLNQMIKALRQPHAGKTVIVTHHAPSGKSVSLNHAQSNINPSFASNLEGLIEEFRPDLWVHGHMHNSSDYRIGETRVICNPKGYLRNGFPENPDFNPELIVDI